MNSNLNSNLNLNIKLQQHNITKTDRAKLNGHSPKCLWMTGLSGSGKSTIAGVLEDALFQKGVHVFILDGDNLRHGLNADLTFSLAGRSENVRRTAHVAKLMTDAGLVVICALISPMRQDRDFARSLFEQGEFIEIHVDTPISVCQDRDPKGLYAKVKSGEIKEFTGIDSPYEIPINPEIKISTSDASPAEAVDLIMDKMW